MTNLTWFQYDVDQWDKRVRELALSVEEEGALMRLVRAAWKPPFPGSILDKDTEFDHILGSRWKKLEPFIRQHFTPDPENAGRLHCLWVNELRQRAAAKHETYVARGKKGGRPKAKDKDQLPLSEAEKKAEVLVPASTTGSSASVPLVRENKTEGKSCDPTGHTAFPPAPTGALGAEPPRATVADDGETAARRLRAEFDAWFHAEFDAWIVLHGEEYASLKRDVLNHCGAPFTSRAKPVDELPIHAREMLLERVRVRAGWPDFAAWIASRLERPSPELVA